jgi:hypothetical protein
MHSGIALQKKMALDEFISLEAPCEADAKDEGGDVQAKDLFGSFFLASFSEKLMTM